MLKGVPSGKVNICFEKKINPDCFFFFDMNISSMGRERGRELAL